MKKLITLLLMAAMVCLPLNMAFARGGDRAGGGGDRAGGRARASDRGTRGSDDRKRQAKRDRQEDKDSGREVDRR
ncbi:MAG: hypothetical protein ACYTDY_16935 [Planctomycetota bacterium]|jgi:hypothetical protein